MPEFFRGFNLNLSNSKVNLNTNNIFEKRLQSIILGVELLWYLSRKIIVSLFLMMPNRIIRCHRKYLMPTMEGKTPLVPSFLPVALHHDISIGCYTLTFLLSFYSQFYQILFLYWLQGFEHFSILNDEIAAAQMYSDT